jgi:hypothetical protein
LSDNFSSVLKYQQQTNGSRAAGHAAQLIASAVAAALQDPEFIVRIRLVASTAGLDKDR